LILSGVLEEVLRDEARFIRPVDRSADGVPLVVGARVTRRMCLESKDLVRSLGFGGV